MDEIPTGTMLVGYCHHDEEEAHSFAALADQLATRLERPVVACALDQPGNPLLRGIATLLRQGAVKIVILPLFLTPAQYGGTAVSEAVVHAARRWPFVHFHLSAPLDWSDWVHACSDSLAEQEDLADRDETTVLLAGRGGSDADINSETYKLARMLYEASESIYTDVAFIDNAIPGISEMVDRYRRLDAQRIIVLPHLLLRGRAYRFAARQAEAAGAFIAPCLAASNVLLELMLRNHARALADRTLLPVSWEEVERQLAAELNNHNPARPGQPASDEDNFQQLTARIDAILPPRYEGRTNAVSAAPMAAADLVFDVDGDVAWDQIFGVDDPDNPFCELALAGGPSHRGELLEPPLATDCLAKPGKQTAVVAEIERGIQMITGLPVVESRSPGWVGVQCDSEEMAIWLVRAIIVENVMVRREDDVIYLPAGPDFTLKNQIKSIVTVTAKTWHYWIEHITRVGMTAAAT